MKTFIETERLILREIDLEADIEPWTEMMSNEDTVRYIGGKTTDRAMTWRSMVMMIGHQKVRGYGFMSVVEKATGAWVGRIGPWYPEGWEEPEIGWTLHKKFTGRGYAKEAGVACVDYVFNTLSWTQLIHVIAHGNIASIKTAEAVGSRYLREAKDNPLFGGLKCHIYGQPKP